MAGGVWLGVAYEVAGDSMSWAAALLTTLIGLLMVSNMRYHSFKQIDFHGKVPFIAVVAVMLAFAVVLTHPPTVLFLLFLAYAASGPVVTVIKLRERRSRRASSEDPNQGG
jgi:CDP-diacylglycerol--serine O-phosphatidyltransferase